MICSKCGYQMQDGMRICLQCMTVYTYPGETDEQARAIAQQQYQQYQQWLAQQQPAPQAQPIQQAQPMQQAPQFQQMSPQQAAPAKKKGKGKVVAIIVVVLLLLGGIGAAAGGGGSKQSTSSGSQAGASSASAEKPNYSNMPIGSTAKLDSGLEVTLNSVETFTPQYLDKEITRVNVTYVNNSDKKQSFNLLDWKAEDSGGAERSVTAWSEGNTSLGSGDLKAGGSTSGNVYFEGSDLTTVYYYSNILFQNESGISWDVG